MCPLWTPHTRADSPTSKQTLTPSSKQSCGRTLPTSVGRRHGGAGGDRASSDPTRALSDIEQAILDFERQWWRQAGAKEQAIRDNFEISPTRYYQQLNALLDLPQALSYDPTLVNRLQRLRATTSRTRRLR